MYKHVFLKIAMSGKVLLTHITLVWFLNRMCKHVHFKIAMTSKCLVTYITIV